MKNVVYINDFISMLEIENNIIIKFDDIESRYPKNIIKRIDETYKKLMSDFILDFKESSDIMYKSFGYQIYRELEEIVDKNGKIKTLKNYKVISNTVIFKNKETALIYLYNILLNIKYKLIDLTNDDIDNDFFEELEDAEDFLDIE